MQTILSLGNALNQGTARGNQNCKSMFVELYLANHQIFSVFIHRHTFLLEHKVHVAKSGEYTLAIGAVAEKC